MLLLSMFLLLEYLERSPAVSWGNLGRFTLIFFYFASLSQISFGCNFLKLFPFQMTLMGTDQEG